ncbi:MAG: IMP dehydrogenase [Chitinophagales bacterium]|nr:IMP dehydrogenase [Chitinophagales bacterium]MDW8428134.1 IMP dehydrogenase [Chitinophagales bacterium]
MSRNKIAYYGLTFDDVLLIPAYSEVLPRDTDISTRLTRSIRLNVPVVSAAMDTVTDWQMAIAMAQQGGIGILHKNMTIERQAEAVRKVKRSESGLIIDPITLKPDQTIAEALHIMKENKIGGIPIVEDSGQLVGILTNRDLRFEKNLRRPISEVMTKDNLVTAPEGTDLRKAEQILQRNKVEKLPVVDRHGRLKGLITYRDIMKLKSHPLACKDRYGRLLVGAAVGITSDLHERIEALLANGVDVICIDTAHGHSRGVLEAVRKTRRHFRNLQLIAGNVGTAEGAVALAEAGADAIKVGIGPGSICTTRVVTGAGVPQLTAIMDAAAGLQRSKKHRDLPIIADGGIRYTGDLVKAIAAGADCVMTGSLFAGTEEAPGETILYEGRKFKSYRGMGSLEAMAEGSKDRYFQDAEDDLKKLVPEGIVGRVPYKGTVAEVMLQIVGGLRAGMGYTGSRTIAELKQKKFVQITAAGMRESHVHDVVIIKEAPNYSP